MNREDALEQLFSESAHDRLKAARFFARNSESGDLERLRAALAGEAVSYVRTGLDIAIQRISNSAFREVEDALDEVEVPRGFWTQVRGKATEEVAGQILHEIASPVGLIASSAAREIPDYPNSRTKRHIGALKRVFDGIEQLKVAAAMPKPEEFDLADLVSEVASEAADSGGAEVALYGARPILVTADPSLLRLAVSNGLRNAVEAVSGCSAEEAHAIVVAWGATDVDYWVSVLDRGPGLVGPAEAAFGIGKTNKRGHSGFGLTIARQASETLGGTCSLQPARGGGARFEVRWQR